MKKIETEIVVIGAGLAGTAAALAAVKSGRRVMVLGRESGASAMNSGALDIAADPGAIPAHPEKWSVDVRKNIEELLVRSPMHPYHLIGDSGEKILEEIKKALALVFPGEDHFLSGEPGRNRLVFNQLGTFKQTALTQARMLSFEDLSRIRKILLVDFSGFRDFDPDFFRRNFLHWTDCLGARVELAIAQISTNGLSDKSSLENARWIEENFEETLEKLKSAVKSSAAELVILPPVIPVIHREELMTKLEQEAGSKVRELLSFPPSVPGKRLGDYLQERLKQDGIERLMGKAAGFEANGQKIKSVLARCESEEVQISAAGFVLATGGFLAGGISKSESFKEEVFGLEVFCGSEPMGTIFTEKLTSARLTNPHPVFSVGLKVSPEMKPLDRDGRITYENLCAAGSVLSGANYIFDGSAAGASLASGCKAGNIAAKSL